jgi:hypothetical protein
MVCFRIFADLFFRTENMNTALGFGGTVVGAGIFWMGRQQANKTEQLKSEALQNIFEIAELSSRCRSATSDIDESRATGIAKLTVLDPKCTVLSVAKQQIVHYTKSEHGMTWTPATQWQPSVHIREKTKLQFIDEPSVVSDASFGRGLNRVFPSGSVSFDKLVSKQAEQIVRAGNDMMRSLKSDAWPISFDKNTTYKCSETELHKRTVYLFGRQLRNDVFTYTCGHRSSCVVRNSIHARWIRRVASFGCCYWAWVCCVWGFVTFVNTFFHLLVSCLVQKDEHKTNEVLIGVYSTLAIAEKQRDLGNEYQFAILGYITLPNLLYTFY